MLQDQTTEEIGLTPEVIAELEKLGVREGDQVGSGATSFTLSPTGSLTRPVSVLSSQTGAQKINEIMEKTNGTQNVYMFASYPSDSDTWVVKFRAGLNGAGANTMTGYAVCVDE